MDSLLNTVDWQSTGNQDDGSGVPYATHFGVLEIFGQSMRCYRLSDGRAVIHADDLHDFFKELA